MRNLKSVIMAAAIALVAVGCGSTGTTGSHLPSKQQTCETATAAYTLYLATTKVRPVTPEESAGAAAAALFLSVYCGWSSSVGDANAPAGAKGLDSAGAKDANGVLILVPPQ